MYFIKRFMSILNKAIAEIFSSWVTIYFTSSIDQYMVMKGRLLDNGIETKPRSSDNIIRGRGHSGLSFPAFYEILVKKEDADVATKIIEGSR